MKEIHATKDDVVRRYKDLSIDDIRLDHLKFSMLEIAQAEVVTIRINRQVRVLKDIWNSWIGK